MIIHNILEITQIGEKGISIFLQMYSDDMSWFSTYKQIITCKTDPTTMDPVLYTKGCALELLMKDHYLSPMLHEETKTWISKMMDPSFYKELPKHYPYYLRLSNTLEV